MCLPRVFSLKWLESEKMIEKRNLQKADQAWIRCCLQTYITCPDSPWGPALAFWAWASGLVGSLTNPTLLSHGKSSLGGSCLCPSLFPTASTVLRKVCQPNCVLLLCWGCHSELEGPVTIKCPFSAMAGVVWQSPGIGIARVSRIASVVV